MKAIMWCCTEHAGKYFASFSAKRNQTFGKHNCGHGLSVPITGYFFGSLFGIFTKTMQLHYIVPKFGLTHLRYKRETWE